MANKYLNCVPLFKEESIVYYIDRKRLQMWYVSIRSIQPKEEYEGLARECHLKIISSLNNLIIH